MNDRVRREHVERVSRDIGRAVRADKKNHRLQSLRDEQWWILANEYPTAADLVKAGIDPDAACEIAMARTEWMRKTLAMDVRAPDLEKPADPVAEFIARMEEAP